MVVFTPTAVAAAADAGATPEAARDARALPEGGPPNEADLSETGVEALLVEAESVPPPPPEGVLDPPPPPPPPAPFFGRSCR